MEGTSLDLLEKEPRRYCLDRSAGELWLRFVDLMALRKLWRRFVDLRELRKLCLRFVDLMELC